MFNFWTLLYSILAGLDLGFCLDYFIHEKNIGDGIFWSILFLLMFIFAIRSLRPRVQLPVKEE